MPNDKPQIFRKRYIPFETVDISADEILHRSESLIITKWKVIRKREDLSAGVSFAFLEEGYKISRFYDKQGRFAYWYCDIIDVEYDAQKDAYTLIDLLLDVKVLPDNTVLVLDADELAEALEKEVISVEESCRALKKLDKLLRMHQEGKFPPPVCLEQKFW